KGSARTVVGRRVRATEASTRTVVEVTRATGRPEAMKRVSRHAVAVNGARSGARSTVPRARRGSGRGSGRAPSSQPSGVPVGVMGTTLVNRVRAGNPADSRFQLY